MNPILHLNHVVYVVLMRRAHVAGAKKIKCDSKHPRCTACATAGTPCHQEDRHRQTLTPRGHTERVEQQVAQCEALLKRHYPGFDLDKLEEILAREGIDVPIPNPTLASDFQFQNASTPYRSGPAQPMAPPGQPGMYYPPPHMMPPPGYPIMPPYGPFPPIGPGPYTASFPPGFQPPGYVPMPPPPSGHVQAPPPPPPNAQSGSGANPNTAQNHGPNIAQPGLPSPPRPNTAPNKGQDPNGNDMSNAEALAKNFGVSPAIVNDLRLASGTADKEDLAVGSSGLSSGRDRDLADPSVPRNITQWFSITVHRTQTTTSQATLALETHAPARPMVEFWLPKDRKFAMHVVDTYFSNLNPHRPVYIRKDFESVMTNLYDGVLVAHDPGYICSLYLVLALGTLSELNHRAVKYAQSSGDVPINLGSATKKLMPIDWPEHDEFFDRALSVKPELRVTLSSLQALILLHWYLYTERQGRTLWRLVGSMVRLAVELGLHHNPRTQINPSTDQKIFTEEESQLRINLWAIVLVHDRGTSILLGRPLAISPGDFDTPQPSRPRDMRASEFSEHFELSSPVAEIQGDIINSLYTPLSRRQSGPTIMSHAIRIIRRIQDFQKGLPERYHYYFTGTDGWSPEKKSQLVQQITEDEGLTLLKLGIARILLLRALFNSKELSYPQRHRALVDAILTSHNMTIIHNQLIRFPHIAFFTSPIPLHIAAMVILYGHMSKCDTLPHSLAVQDLWLALDMLPRFRWRWERRDSGGGHPLIAKLAERVMEVDLKTVGPVVQTALLCEPQWDDDSGGPSLATSTQGTPTMTSAPYAATKQPGVAGGPGTVYNSHPRSSAASGGGTPSTRQLAEVPTQLFYPFYPEYHVPPTGNGNGGQQRDYLHLLEVAAATAEQGESYGSQPMQFISEENNGLPQGTQMWMTTGKRRYGAASS